MEVPGDIKGELCSMKQHLDPQRNGTVHFPPLFSLLSITSFLDSAQANQSVKVAALVKHGGVAIQPDNEV